MIPDIATKGLHDGLASLCCFQVAFLQFCKLRPVGKAHDPCSVMPFLQAETVVLSGNQHRSDRNAPAHNGYKQKS